MVMNFAFSVGVGAVAGQFYGYVFSIGGVGGQFYGCVQRRRCRWPILCVCLQHRSASAVSVAFLQRPLTPPTLTDAEGTHRKLATDTADADRRGHTDKIGH